MNLIADKFQNIFCRHHISGSYHPFDRFQNNFITSNQDIPRVIQVEPIVYNNSSNFPPVYQEND